MRQYTGGVEAILRTKADQAAEKQCHPSHTGLPEADSSLADPVLGAIGRHDHTGLEHHGSDKSPK